MVDLSGVQIHTCTDCALGKSVRIGVIQFIICIESVFAVFSFCFDTSHAHHATSSTAEIPGSITKHITMHFESVDP